MTAGARDGRLQAAYNALRFAKESSETLKSLAEDWWNPQKPLTSCCAFFLSIAHAAGACKGRTFVRERASKCRPARKVAKKMVQKMAHVLGSHAKAWPLNANAASMAPVESGQLCSCRPIHRKPPRCPAAPWFGPSWGGCPCRRQHDREKAVVPDRDR